MVNGILVIVFFFLYSGVAWPKVRLNLLRVDWNNSNQLFWRWELSVSFFFLFLHLGLRWSPQYELLKVTQGRPGVCQTWTYFPNAPQMWAVVLLIWPLLIESTIPNMLRINKSRWEEADAPLSSPPPSDIRIKHSASQRRPADGDHRLHVSAFPPKSRSITGESVRSGVSGNGLLRNARRARRVESWTSHAVRVRRIALLKTVSEIVLQSLVSPRLRGKPNKTPQKKPKRVAGFLACGWDSESAPPPPPTTPPPPLPTPPLKGPNKRQQRAAAVTLIQSL